MALFSTMAPLFFLCWIDMSPRWPYATFGGEFLVFSVWQFDSSGLGFNVVAELVVIQCVCIIAVSRLADDSGATLSLPHKKMRKKVFYVRTFLEFFWTVEKWIAWPTYMNIFPASHNLPQRKKIGYDRSN